MRSDMHQRFGGVRKQIDELRDETNRRLDSRLAIMLTAMIALTGVIVATIKL